MARKYVATYKKLAAQRGVIDPLAYIFKRYHTLSQSRKKEDQQAALQLAILLVPYGHAKLQSTQMQVEARVSGVLKLH